MSNWTLTWHFLIYQVLPYVVIAVLIVGSLARYIVAPYSWKSQSSEILDKSSLNWGANLFHIGVIFLLGGHIIGLYTPSALLEASGITPRMHQMLEIIMGGISATIAISGLIILTGRRLFNPRVRISSRKSDFLVLFILLAVILFGIASIINSYEYDRSGATLILFRDWASGIFTFDPNAWKNLLYVPCWQKWHIFIGLLVFLIVPFTRLVHAWSGYFTPLYLMRPHQIMRANGKPMK